MNMDNTISKRKYSCRDEQIRAELSLQEVIRRITYVYHSEYDLKTVLFDAWDQLLACEALAESTPIRENRQEQSKENVNGSGNGMNNGGYKQTIIFELTPNKQQVVTELSKCNCKIPPIKLAQLLEEFFKEWKSKDTHWLYIAQTWNPREINRTLNQIIKLQISGRTSIQNPAAYFTKIIKFRAKKKQ